MYKIKAEIEEKLNTLKLEEAGELISKYAHEAPMDLDLIVYNSIFYLYSGNLDVALEYGLLGVQRYPSNGDLYYNLACIYEQRGEMIDADRNYIKAFVIYTVTKDSKAVDFGLESKISEIEEKLLNIMKTNRFSENGLNKEEIAVHIEQRKNYFGLQEAAYRSIEYPMIGRYYWMTRHEKRYIGEYGWIQETIRNTEYEDLMHRKGEFLKVTEGEQYLVEGNAEEYLLPIAVENRNTLHFFAEEGIIHPPVLQLENKHFNYYRVKKGTSIQSEGKSFYGKEIPLGVDSTKKKLVLNIFVDGLSQEILNGQEFERIMPYTYQFFKKGTICTRAYATAEWTYPSIATYVSGLDTTHHMLFHSIIDNELPENIVTLPEYFQEAGYFTSKMCGNWRIIPTYGHARGYDQFVYQHQWSGFKVEQLVGEVIGHLEAFKETNQFLWMSIGDLHDVADDIDLALAVQNGIDLDVRGLEKTGYTSAKQEYSENRIEAYKKTASYIDVFLSLLYHYIEDRYTDDEIVVSLFSDHGQAFLVPVDAHFMSKERAKIAFMIRGGNGTFNSACDEIISTCDYLKIMCKLAGIPMKDIKTDGNLPVCFGGQKEREYALDESIFPGDPYYATFFTKNYTVYFENGMPTGEDGRFELRDYTINIEDLAGNPIIDQSLCDKYLDILLEHIAPLLIYDL